MQTKEVVLKTGGKLNVRNGVVDKPFIESLVRQIKILQKHGFVFIWFVSGAIPIGELLSQDEEIDKTDEGKAWYSMIGQIELAKEIQEIFFRHGIMSGQGLYTRRTLENPFASKVFRYALNKSGVILANENDGVSPEELDGDNDLPASKVAVKINADYFINLTDVEEGVQCNKPSREGMHCDNGVLKIIGSNLLTDDFIKSINNGKTSRPGSNGIKTKLSAGRDAVNGGVKKAIIAPGGKENILLEILLKNEFLGTTIVS
jgi:glutamate 5-kinase